ncbi:MAG: Na/Pi cotransporter family protein [Elusimicrobiaceae bacterium]|nr:Na/Pi cotransporter family protein [Elusimicrobiaceae bacterium]
MKAVLLTLNLLGGMGIFLYGMKIMSDGLQKMAGVKMRQMLSIATANRFAATFSGMLVTAIIQASGATTVMVVGFTSAGLLTLTQALGVIFGANIGTTMTAWIVSVFGFKVQISLFALPVIAVGFFSQFLPSKWVSVRRIGEAAIGFGLLFLGLDIMKNTIPADFAQSPFVVNWLSKLTPDTLWSLMGIVLIGSVLTVILQSSSAVMAMTLTCAAAGIINFPTACALVLGENIGTTITANFAAIGASKNAQRAALGHFLFNFLGVVWVSLIFNHFVHFIDWLVPGNPASMDPESLNSVLPYHISAFHTVFNILNTLIMLAFLKQLAKLTMIIIPKSKREDKHSDSELVFLNTRLNQTPELAIVTARKEVERMMKFVSKLVDKLIYAIKTDDEKLFERLISDAKEMEHTTDVLEHKINTYLTQLTHGNLSRHAIAQTVSLIDLTNSIEGMGDCGEKIARILEKFRNTNPASFTEKDLENMELIAKKTKENIKHARLTVSYFPNIATQDKERAGKLFETAVKNEEKLNAMRKELRSERNERISKGELKASPSSITAYGDILNNFERMGDYAMRVSESVLRTKIVGIDERNPVGGMPTPTSNEPIA